MDFFDKVKRNPNTGIDDLRSEFDAESDAERKRKRTDFLEKEYSGEAPKPKRSEGKHWFQDEHGRAHRQMSRLMTLNAYQRHKEIINMYYLSFPGSTKLLQPSTSHERTDYDVLKDNHRFLWSEEDESRTSDSWEARMAKKYYDKLFKEYCIVDLTYFKKNKVAMRWRTEKEVREGKGQFECGNKKCKDSIDLRSWEVNFGYVENGERKNALVKVRLCPQCSEMLNYSSTKRRVEKKSSKKWGSKRKDSPKDTEREKSPKKEEPQISNEKAGKPTESVSADIWEAPVVQDVERTVDEDIDDFLDDLFE
ncbi:unnamed protein product [Caenorhabditis auriculariae]|uniref:Protein FRA10AC1 n=1 Tax=Caenorhabditis auriculariae TaxID=2777116 RepID=A0A8S1HM55_9PELO|nr:unnamed protein product [Caenorhabditis auriculariae]